MKRYSVTFFLGQSFRGLWRNGVMTIASILVLLSCLIVMGSFTALILNINYNLDSLDMLNQIVVSIDPEKSVDETLEIGEKIRGFDNVAQIDYISKADALEEMREMYGDDPDTSNLLDGYDEYNNPFPAEFLLSYADSENLETLLYRLKETDGVTDVVCYAEEAETIDGIKNTVSIIFIWFLAILFVVSIFVIINTIRLALFSRKQEITVMRYVGATNWFITLPFLLEGTFIGIISAAIGYLAEWYLYVRITAGITAGSNILRFIPFSNLSIQFLIGFFAVGTLTGILGSIISIRRYLNA